MSDACVEVVELVTTVVEIVELSTGGKGDAGVTPAVQAALNAAVNPSAENSFQTKTDSIALIIALGG
jgi:hypothetical protein